MVVVDTSIWVALINQKDTCHKKAWQLISNLYNDEVVLMDHVYSETLTVLRNKNDQKMEKEFKNMLRDLDIEYSITPSELFRLADLIFMLNPKISFIDCLLMGSARTNDCQLLTFDKDLQKAWNKISEVLGS